MNTHPDAAVRVITIHQTASRESWAKALKDLGIADSARWANYYIADQANAELVSTLRIAGESNASYLVDPDGCVVHSSLASETQVHVIERALEKGETCAQ